jgi:hypothetical protein
MEEQKKMVQDKPNIWETGTQAFRKELFAEVKKLTKPKPPEPWIFFLKVGAFVFSLISTIAIILGGVLFIIRAENKPIKIDIQNMKEDIREIKEEDIQEIKEACKPIKSEDELAFFIDRRNEIKIHEHEKVFHERRNQ